MKNYKINDEGFSLVELIIVIAIMAILAAALAPQLIKYLEETRESVDHQVVESVETCFNAAVKEEDIYREIVASDKTTFDIAFNSDGEVIWPKSDFPELSEELAKTLEDIKTPKTSGASKYVVSWKNSDNEIINVEVITA